MSHREPASAGEPTPPNTGPAQQPPPPAAPMSEPAREPAAGPAPEPQKSPQKQEDPLRGTFTSHTWIALIALLVVLVLLAVFVLQNTESVSVTYFGFTGQSPLAVALLLAFAAGLLVAGIVGTLRIWQLRRRVRKAR